VVNPIGIFICANQEGTAAKNWVRITGERRQNPWWFQLIRKLRRRTRCSELALVDRGIMRGVRNYEPGIGMKSRLGYAGGAAKAFTGDSVADNHSGYSSSIGARISGAEMMES